MFVPRKSEREKLEDYRVFFFDGSGSIFVDVGVPISTTATTTTYVYTKPKKQKIMVIFVTILISLLLSSPPNTRPHSPPTPQYSINKTPTFPKSSFLTFACYCNFFSESTKISARFPSDVVVVLFLYQISTIWSNILFCTRNNAWNNAADAFPFIPWNINTRFSSFAHSSPNK